MHQPRALVHANVCLHPEVPLIAFLGLMHLPIARTRLILRRRRRRKDRRVHHRARRQPHPVLVQVRADHRKQLLR